MKRYRVGILVLILGLLMATTAQAALFRVGPNDVPSPPGNGYPLWYQDTVGVALDLCAPQTLNQLDACLAAPLPGDPLPTVPFVFPTNWPDELFWYGADAILDFDANNSAILVQALEAAFGGGPAAVGDQIVFGRVRIRIDAPVDGTYTVTYPYGEQIFPNVTAGTKAINVTSDIGIGAAGDFTGALKSAIGPFLIPVTPPVLIDGSTFLSDGLAAAPVTGSPFGTNFFRVCVDNPLGLDGLGGPQCMETADFTVIGKVHQGAIGSPLTLDRATYARSAGSAHVDVFATASSGPGALAPVLSFGDAAGTNLLPSTRMNGPTNLGQYYGQSIPAAARVLPAAVIVSNVADNPPSSISRSLVDEVTITEASYDPGAGTLTIMATSSDKGDSVAPAILPPQLFAIGLPGSATGSEALTSTTNALDPAEQQISFIIPAPLPLGGPVPPFAVTVISSAGGLDAEAVSATAGPVFAAGAPVAVADSVSFVAGSATSVTVDVLANDFGFNPATVRIVSQGSNGTAVANPVTGVVTFTFTNNLLLGDDTFTYTVRSAPVPGGLESNVATVTVTTTAPGPGAVPIAAGDGPFSVSVNAALVIPAATLLANDSGNGGVIDPNSILIGSATGGSAVFAAGAVTYTAGATPGSFLSAFTYTVANTNGQRSLPASVEIEVLPATDTLIITAAGFRTGTRRWDVSGTSTVSTGNTVTVRLIRTGVVIGTAPVVAGAWSLRALNSNVIAVNGDQVRATSTAGGNATLAVRVRQ